MPRKKVQKAVTETPDRFKLSSIGYSGINVIAGVSNEEIKRDLNFPNSIATYKQMSYHSSINSALSLYEYIIGKATYRVNSVKDATEEEKQQAEFIKECLTDMQGNFDGVIQDALTSNIYGFSVLEKVYRRRYKSNGSQYDDGKIGWKKIALRNQETIAKFIYDPEADEVIGVKQSFTAHNGYGSYAETKKADVILPREKFLLFTTGRARNNPYGVSPLRDVWLAWRYLTAIEELEAAGVAKDLQGVPVLSIPPQYMSPDATDEQKALYSHFQNIVKNLQQNTQSGVILPSAVDPETRQPMFKLELLSSQGKKNYDTDKVKEYYQNLIVMGLFADILKMGTGNTGSYALGTLKNSLTGSAIETMLTKILSVINDDLIKQTYELNGWNTARRCTIDVENLQDIDLESYSKAIQRFASVGYLPKTHDVINNVLSAIDIDPLDEDVVLDEVLPNSTSRSGDGMKVGTTGNGTSTSVASTDNSSINLDNAG